MNINELLNKMHKSGKVQDYKEKGNLGEEAVYEICVNRIGENSKDLLYGSFMYPYATSKFGTVFTGNIVYIDGAFKDYTDKSLNDEIDVLYITSYRIFVIEVKSYHVNRIDVYDHWCNKNSTPMEKSPITQVEKHARHCYHTLYEVLPDGNPNYIVPIVCFVDNCTVRDDRSPIMKQYIPVCTLNNLNATLSKNNVPLEYNLALDEINRKIHDAAVSIKKENQ